MKQPKEIFVVWNADGEAYVFDDAGAAMDQAIAETKGDEIPLVNSYRLVGSGRPETVLVSTKRRGRKPGRKPGRKSKPRAKPEAPAAEAEPKRSSKRSAKKGSQR